MQFNSNSGNEIKINVHDIRGREIYSKSYTNNGLFNENLQLSNVQSGVYLVTVQDGSKKEVKKVVVQ
ncbi:T9SS type A sorting domain-containing protein [Flavobacterium sp. LMO9]|nr:T9SS type A sorting domain-containing protein [Flavobacterium sp. LMO9]